MKNFFLFVLLNCLINFVFASNQTIIRFATEATYPPFESIDAHGKITGFDIAIANALCKKLNAICVFSNQSFNSLIPSLNLGKYDAIIAAIGVTPEREQAVDFTYSYYQPSASFVANNNKQIDVNHISHLTIGVQQGSTFEKFMQDKYHNKINLKSYMSIQDAFLDLNAERLDMILTDTPIATAWLGYDKNKTEYHIVGKPISDVGYFGSGYAIAVKKNNSVLLKKLNQALAEIKANGEYQKIINQYFPVEMNT